MRVWMMLIGFVLFSLPALADRGAAERCATGLQPMGLQLFQRALPGVLGGASIPDALRSAATSMVMSGVINRDAARPNAEAASTCLALMGRPG